MKNLNFAMKEGEKIVYTGNRFKSFLKRNSISYKEAADTLGIDKNTVGKAVRGGNLNVDIILRICNVYDMDITDFFVVVGSDGAACGADYYNSLSSEIISTQIVSEEDFSYNRFGQKSVTKEDIEESSNNEIVKESKEQQERPKRERQS